MLTTVWFMSAFLIFMSVFLVEFSVIQAVCALRWASVDPAGEEGFLYTAVRPLGRKRDRAIVLVFAYCGLERFVLSSFIFVMRFVTRRMLPLRGLLAV